MPVVAVYRARRNHSKWTGRAVREGLEKWESGVREDQKTRRDWERWGDQANLRQKRDDRARSQRRRERRELAETQWKEADGE